MCWTSEWIADNSCKQLLCKEVAASSACTEDRVLLCGAARGLNSSHVQWGWQRCACKCI